MNLKRKIWLSLLAASASLYFLTASALAIQNPQSGSIGIEGTLGGAPPTQAATITTPSNGASFTNLPITVSGICPTGLLIKVFDNNVFVGSASCNNGSFSLQIDLFSGSNTLVARDYDALDQAGPDSNNVTVNFSSNVTAFSSLSLTSSFAVRGANPGESLDWPLGINGGIAPYAISVDWGDGSTPTLYSESFSGTFTISHTYQTSGLYKLIIRATDKNGQNAFLQLVAIANGPITQSNSKNNGSNTKTVTKVVWWPAVVMLPLLLISFWLGRRHELLSLRKRLERSTVEQQ